MKLATIIAICLIQVNQARTFTNTEGQTVDAKITKVEGDQVQLKISGKLHMVKISSLIESDQTYIKEWKPSNKKSLNNRTSGNTKGSFDGEWPDSINGDRGIEISVIKEDEDAQKYIYQSPNYEFICDVKLSKTVVKKFAILFEATRDYCHALPIEMLKVPEDADSKDKVLLFERKETYVKNGASPSSAGVYMPSSNTVMVPLTSLGLKKVGSGYMFDYKGANKTLPHEITHQLTTRKYYNEGTRGWFTEGLADYIAVTPYTSGRYGVKTAFSSVRAYATEYGKKGNGGRALGKEIHAPDLKDYMLQPYSSFTGDKASLNYGLALLITYYYFHMEEDRTNINNFLKAIKSGKKGDEALNVLLNGRTWSEMEEDIHVAWRKRGVKIHFK